jgi:hypothetical protein
MLELTINGKVYEFKFGMGFMREVNKYFQKPIDGIKDAKENVGLQMMVAGIYAKDAEYLARVLDAANKGFSPRVTVALLDAYIDECEDIDQLFEDVLDFLKTANATKNVTNQFIEQMEAAMEKQTQNQ